MKNGPSGKVTFKPYHPDQATFLPPSLEELIPADHPVRLVSSSIDSMNLDPILEAYRGGGTSAYHPRMLLKVIVYGYLEKVYSSRRIAKAVRENIHFMWLAGGNRPDFRTIARFRSSRLKTAIDEVFAALMEILVEHKLVRLETVFVDGTKMEANANRYSHIWRKSKDRHQEALRRKVAALLEEIDEASDREDKDYGNRDLEEVDHEGTITAEKLAEKVAELNDRLKQQPDDKPLKRTVKKLEEDYQPRLKKYEQQEALLGDRNSCSKTDPEATFMRMKDDHLGNAPLKPAYNLQLSTENQFILGYSVHQNPGDASLLIPHMEKLERLLGRLPEATVADAAYGSEENYAWLEERNSSAFIKYALFEKESTGKLAKSPFRSENWPYNPEADVFICPAGAALTHRETFTAKSTTGYKSQWRIYTTPACNTCSLRAECLRGESNRKVSYGPVLAEYRARARERLMSDRGKWLRIRRGVEVEGAFAQIKQNMGYRRFLLRGLDKVNVECGLIALAYNLKRWWRLVLRAFCPDSSLSRLPVAA